VPNIFIIHVLFSDLSQVDLKLLKFAIVRSDMDVERYLKCIGYEGSREPTLENLEALSFSHKLAVPYSNLHYFGGPITNLDLEVLFDKIVVKGSGGTCYEMNGLFKWLLRQLGYNVTTTQGNWFMPEYQKWTVDYFHMILLVSVKLSKFRHFLRIPWCVSEFLL